MNEFLPEDYKSPSNSQGYAKLQDGENRYRILTKPILGWEDWENDKPKRFPMQSKPATSFNPDKPVRHFWAFVVWDYMNQKICILHLTQASIRKKLEDLSKDQDWGSPFQYDIKIRKSGSKMQMKYDVSPVAHKEVDQAIKAKFMEMPIDLEQLFLSQDPFSSKTGRTKAFWEGSYASIQDTTGSIMEPCISQDFADQLESQISSSISPVDAEWRERALKAFKVAKFSELKVSQYARMLDKVKEKIKALQEEEIPF